MRRITAEAVKPLLTASGEIALVDVREAGQFGEGHPFFAVNIPYSRLEARARQLMPRRSVRIVLLDAGDGIAERAAGRLVTIGYTDVSVMDGGAPAWEAAGFTLYKGVNLPSKSFGELVEHDMGTPSITAAELKAAQERGEDLVLLDGRTPQEHERMAIPGARFCANAELAYRLPALGIGPRARIVVHCAGRTRSIIGAQTLRNLGVPQRVAALENGTQGWELAGFALERGRRPERLPELSPEQREITRHAAQHLMLRAGLVRLSVEELIAERRNGSRTHYLFDVRTEAEFRAGHIAGAIHAPGGQLVQATDLWIAVRGARVVLADDVGMRAATTALWLRGMGHDVALLDADASGVRPDLPAPKAHGLPALAVIDPAEARRRMDAGEVLLDLASSMAYRGSHIDGARWAIRPRIGALDLAGATAVLLIAPHHAQANAAALEIAQHHGLASSIVAGGPGDWEAAGFRFVETPDDPPDAECIDHLFFTHDRHSGNLATARAYLDWETGLVAQLDAQERAVLRPELSRPG